MAIMQVKPTRMELQNLKKRLKVATRGHKLMKDKRDELVRRFMKYIRKNKELRESVEAVMGTAMKRFVYARAKMSPYDIEEALSYPSANAKITTHIRSELSVSVPVFEATLSDAVGLIPYGFANTSFELDSAIIEFSQLLPKLIELAEVEKTCNLLANEIEKTRRRVNALEYVMIPQLEETIRAIKMKLDENERGNLTRLMKTKEMLNNK
ncbi:MAG: V-type ATP synthase subunit D [Clostridiales bacterium]|nr:V-type ATP synthase subunit D [Clostridiales bacterium]